MTEVNKSIDERVAFESWAAQSGFPTDRYKLEPETYNAPSTHCAWAAWQARSAEIQRLTAERDMLSRMQKQMAEISASRGLKLERLRAALQDLARAYVNLLEAGMDRIISLGGDCDPVDVMERGDPYLRKAREALRPADEVQS